MKLAASDLLSELSRPQVYLRHYGRMYPITALTTSADEANAYMLTHAGESLLAEHNGFCFVAPDHEETLPLHDLTRALIGALAEAGPEALKSVSNMLDTFGTSAGSGRARERRIAREFAPVFLKLRK